MFTKSFVIDHSNISFPILKLASSCYAMQCTEVCAIWSRQTKRRCPIKCAENMVVDVQKTQQFDFVAGQRCQIPWMKLDVLTHKLQLVGAQMVCVCVCSNGVHVKIIVVFAGFDSWRSKGFHTSNVSGFAIVGRGRDTFTHTHTFIIWKQSFATIYRPNSNAICWNAYRRYAELFNKVELVHIPILLFVIVNKISQTFNRINLSANAMV